MDVNKFEEYEKILINKRNELFESLIPLLTEKNSSTILLFWIISCARSIAMTEPVEDWIRRAGEKTIKEGYKELGEQLIKHAHHESNHHLMMIEDTENLIKNWNSSYQAKLGIDTINNYINSKYVIAYRNLHENYINSSEPYCQIAIEYEIENLSASFIKNLLGKSIEVFGDSIKRCLTFVCEHVQLDVGHTEYNKRCLANFINKHPEKLPFLIEAGMMSLKIYKEFLLDNYQFSLTPPKELFYAEEITL